MLTTGTKIDATLLSRSTLHVPYFTMGPIVDSCAPYSAIGFLELHNLAPFVVRDWNAELESAPVQFSACPRCQYGTAWHASPARQILSSVPILRTNTHLDEVMEDLM